MLDQESTFVYNFKDDLSGIGDDLVANQLFEGIRIEDLHGLDVTLGGIYRAPGELVCSEGEVDTSMYLVLSGAVLISKTGRGGQQESLGIIAATEFFGESALLEDTRRNTSASAVVDTVLMAIDERSLRNLVLQAPEIGLNFARSAMKRLRVMNSTFVSELMEAERLSMVGTMVGSIVHDFKNPMNTIIQAASFLKGRKDDPVLQEVGGYLEHSVNTMEDMTQELLDFSRGKSSVQLVAITVKELVEELDRQILNHMPKHIELALEVLYEGALTGDLSRLTRLFANIIKNAVEAMPGGGRLVFRTREDGDLVRFEIEDNGCGIPRDVMRRIFEPFVTHGKSNGTGLGMSIAKSVVEAHQGEIRIDSKEGKGTTFHIALPKHVPGASAR